MEIIYLGHSAFKIRGKAASLVTDPFTTKSTGFTMPKVSADIVTVSHDHDDHNAIQKVGGTTRREKPYVVKAPGEYEVNGVGVFGWGSYHDESKGSKRGKNTMYTIMIEGVTIGHLGDLGTKLNDDQIEGLGIIDVLLVPVGGVYTINPEQAVEVVNQLQPSWVIPMHYKTDRHNQEIFGEMATAESFLKAMGGSSERMDKLSIQAGQTKEEVAVVLLNPPSTDAEG